MSAPKYTECSKDTDCTADLYGEGACCYYSKIKKVSDDPTSVQALARSAYAALGFPIKEGDHYKSCEPKLLWTLNKDAADQTYEEPSLGFTINGYCAGAMALQTAGALASLMMAAAY